jgi:hypothetical protein
MGHEQRSSSGTYLASTATDAGPFTPVSVASTTRTFPITATSTTVADVLPAPDLNVCGDMAKNRFFDEPPAVVPFAPLRFHRILSSEPDDATPLQAHFHVHALGQCDCPQPCRTSKSQSQQSHGVEDDEVVYV